MISESKGSLKRLLRVFKCIHCFDGKERNKKRENRGWKCKNGDPPVVIINSGLPPNAELPEKQPNVVNVPVNKTKGGRHPRSNNEALGPKSPGVSNSKTRRWSTGRSLSSLRDSYIGFMLNVADVSSQNGSSAILGSSGVIHSQIFDSQVIKKRSQVDQEMIDYCLQSSIQPSDWKEAQTHRRIFNHSDSKSH